MSIWGVLWVGEFTGDILINIRGHLQGQMAIFQGQISEFWSFLPKVGRISLPEAVIFKLKKQMKDHIKDHFIHQGMVHSFF